VLSRTVTHSDTSTYNLYRTGTTEGIHVAPATVMAFDIMVIGSTDSAPVAVAFRFEGLIKHANATGTTSFVGTVTKTTIDNSEDADLDVNVVADNANEALQIQVEDTSGDAGQIQWKANARLCYNLFGG